MPKEITVVRYSFSELSPEAQEKACEYAAREADQFFDTDAVTLTMHDELEQQLVGEVTQMQLKDITFPEWDMSNGTLSIVGLIEKSEAPLLQWPDTAEFASFTADFYGQHVKFTDENDDEVEAATEVHNQLRNIKANVYRAGQKDYEYITGLEFARESLINWERDGDGTQVAYLEDGTFDLPKGVIR